MCRIGITLNTITPVGTSIVSANGRYRLVGTTTWTTFPINLGNPQTPNITTTGSYELQVNVTNNLNETSPWANGTFSISTNCPDNNVDNGLGCRRYLVTNVSQSTGVWNYQYLDCSPDEVDPEGGNENSGGVNLNIGESAEICADFGGPLGLQNVLNNNPGISFEDLGPCNQ